MIDKRKYDRFNLHKDVMFSDQLTHPHCYYGCATLNYSKSGICLVSRYEAILGSSLCLRMIGNHLNSCNSLNDLTCMAEVKWCNTAGFNEDATYRIGLRYLGDQVPNLFTPFD
jgi:hypothetical protein